MKFTVLGETQSAIDYLEQLFSSVDGKTVSADTLKRDPAWDAVPGRGGVSRFAKIARS